MVNYKTALLLAWAFSLTVLVFSIGMIVGVVLFFITGAYSLVCLGVVFTAIPITILHLIWKKVRSFSSNGKT